MRVSRVIGRRRQASDTAAALLRISSSIDDYLYTNEHLADGGRRSVFAGPNREKLMGGPVPEGEDIAREWERLIHPDDWNAHLAHRERLARGEPSEVMYRLRGYDGVTRWIHGRTHSHREGSRMFVDGIVSDVTERKAAEEALATAQEELSKQAELNAYQALHDPLTGLGNRRKLLAGLEETIADGDGREGALLLLCDLNGFKLYNDLFGHPAGDALLARLGRRLEEAVGERGAAYRLGGDEFCVLVYDAEDEEEFGGLVEEALREHGEAFSVTTAWGAARLVEGRDAGSALSDADQELYRRKRGNRRSTSEQVADALVAAFEERDRRLGKHLGDVGEMASIVARRMGFSAAEAEALRHAGRLHDIGKMAIPDEILNKADVLSEDEWVFVRQHPVIGQRIVAAAASLADAGRLIRSSHERFDGTGYPDRLAGQEIPLGSRIIAVCDAFDAMVGPRPYRDGMSEEQALAELHRCAGTQFDPGIVPVVTSIVREGFFPQAA